MIIKALVIPMIILAVSCKSSSPPPEPKQIVQTVGGGVSAVCTLLEGMTSSGDIVAGCVTAEELVQIADFIVSRFALKSNTNCEQITENVCATKREIGLGLEWLASEKTKRFYKDAGK